MRANSELAGGTAMNVGKIVECKKRFLTVAYTDFNPIQPCHPFWGGTAINNGKISG